MTINLSNILIRKPRHKWFAGTDRQQEDGWLGPHNTIEEAILEQACDPFFEISSPIWIAQGRKMTKEELDEFDAGFTWTVDTKNAIKIYLPEYLSKL